MKLSAVIITLNEEKNLDRCLKSLSGIADEIVVVDSFSIDRTADIDHNHGAVFIRNKFEGHIQQKNFALAQAQFDWILSLDADEALDDILRISISEVITIGTFETRTSCIISSTKPFRNECNCSSKAGDVFSSGLTFFGGGTAASPRLVELLRFAIND